MLLRITANWIADLYKVASGKSKLFFFGPILGFNVNKTEALEIDELYNFCYFNSSDFKRV